MKPRYHTGPPRNGTSPALNRGRKTAKILRRHYPSYRFFATIYPQVLADGYANGLLAPFRCAVCGVVALDPIGRNSRQEWLCGRCA
jgi:hypothetical protein